MRRPRRTRAFFEDDGGFSTAGMVIALLVTLSLIFSAVQVYRVQSAAADIQNVADAAALAAENQVASFYIVAQVCDAAALSLTLTGSVAAAVGVVAICVPGAQTVGGRLIEASRRIFESRDRFVDRAAAGLDRMQKLLPYIAAAQAAAVTSANNTGSSSYFGFAVLLPVTGNPVDAGQLAGSTRALDDIENQKDAIADAARQAEEAAREANDHKRRAFEADCGNNPSYCMYERAATLAGMAGSDNPLYRSVDIWSFSVAMRRAQAYYPLRLNREKPQGASVGEQANSALRVRFYTYACERIAQGYVNEDADAFRAYFPLLPRNTDEMRETALYTEAVYPITADDQGNRLMHAWSGCPVAQTGTSAGIGSVAQWEAEHMESCPACEFSAASVGSIAAASTSIENGFEHHYNIVAQEAAAYQKARERYDPEAQKVKGPVKDLLGEVGELMSSAARARINVSPPGRAGAVAIVSDTSGVPVSRLVPTSFVGESGELGTRAAISAATLADDDSSETENVITSLLDGVSLDGQASGWGFGTLLIDAWGGLLQVYGKGQEALVDAIESALNAIPLASESGLGSWAAKTLRESTASLGLEPAKLSAGKPVLVNTYHVASADGSEFSQSLIRVKTAYAQMPGSGTGDPLMASASALEDAVLQGVDEVEDRMVVAVIDFLGAEGTGFPIEVALPPAVKQTTASVIESAFQGIRSTVASLTGVRVWE